MAALLAVPFLTLLAACAPVRPVAKVGLLAPFEGLYRRSGYEALAAARGAIEAAAPALAAVGVEIVPLALDTSLAPQRAAEKLLADPALAVVVGPLMPADAPALTAALAGAGVPWLAPYAVGPQGFLPPQEGGWAVEWVKAVAEAAQAQGAERLVLAGWEETGWPPPQNPIWQGVNQLPLAFVGNGMGTDGLGPGDALLWAGSPVQGAAFLGKLRGAGLATPFWLGPGSADATFVEHASATLKATPANAGDVLWLTWREVEYTGAGAPIPMNDETIPSLHSSLTGAATRAALALVAGESAPATTPGPRFRPAVFRLGPNGSLTPVLPALP